MKQILLASALAFAAMTTFALAESVISAGGQAGPVQLTSAQMDKVTAGDNPHTKHNSTGNPHGVNPGGNTGGCSNNKNCTPKTGNPH